MKKVFALIVAMAMMLMGCTAFAATDITDGVIKVEGVGALQNPNAAAGYRAAKMDAMRNALEEAQGVYIDSETTVRDSVMASDVIKTRINGMIKGAKVVQKYKDADGYHVVIELPVIPSPWPLLYCQPPPLHRLHCRLPPPLHRRFR